MQIKIRGRGQIICEESKKIIIQIGQKEDTVKFSYHSKVNLARTSRSVSPPTEMWKGCNFFVACDLFHLPQDSSPSTTAHLLHLGRQMGTSTGSGETRIPQRMLGTSCLCLISGYPVN